ncbi:MAG: translation elongation factor Ts [Mariprofundaceae bacterium]
MAQITAANVKALRERTGAGMMDCKKALAAADGDINAAIDNLRKKGLSAMANKSGRVAAEGMVAAEVTGNTGVILEVNSETDFVAKNKEFQEFVNNLLELIIKSDCNTIEALMDEKFDEQGQAVSLVLTKLIAKIGEKITVRRFEKVHIENGVVATYVHAGGKIASMVSVDTLIPAPVEAISKDIAMHVAASNPLFINREDVSSDALEREKNVLTERAAASGKPENIIERIVTGQLNKYYAENCLVEQPFVKDSDQTVSQLLASADTEARVSAIYRYQLGEGIEKKESDFAAEVSAQIHG